MQLYTFIVNIQVHYY